MPTDIPSRLDAAHLSVYRVMPGIDLRDIPRARESTRAARLAMQQAPVPDDVAVTDHLVPGPEGAPEVMVRTYRSARADGSGPGFFWIHGGGMVVGEVSMNDEYCTSIAHDLGIVVASVEYRLAPEHPFPAPLEDCYAGLRWFHANARDLGASPDRLAIGGASAGGGLCAGLALLARDRGEVPVIFQLLVYPMLDDRNETRSSHEIVDPKVWNRQSNEIGWNAYLAGRAGAADVSPYAAPARATDLAGLPPAHINVGDLDLFLDEDVAYAQAMQRAGVPTELHVYPGAFHASATFVSRAPLSQRWAADERAALARGLGLRD